MMAWMGLTRRWEGIRFRPQHTHGESNLSIFP
jgi:hypothetical protein